MFDNIPYKSFCWGLGTTSFRTKNFNKTIEDQLSLLDEFWNTDDNSNYNWNGNNVLQTKYYDFMHEKGFVKGEANNKPKDAREKTSGLVDIGLIDDNRKITGAAAGWRGRYFACTVCAAAPNKSTNFIHFLQKKNPLMTVHQRVCQLRTILIRVTERTGRRERRCRRRHKTATLPLRR